MMMMMMMMNMMSMMMMMMIAMIMKIMQEGEANGNPVTFCERNHREDGS